MFFLGRLSETAGMTETTVDLPSDEMELEAFCALVTRSNPELANLIHKPSVLIVINQVMVLQDAVVRDGDEVAFLPPVSGG